MTTTPERSRTTSWEDPTQVLAAAGGRSGLELMRSLVAGEFPAPPIASTLGFTLTEVDEGRAVFQLDPGEFHYNPIGSVHGGVYATLLDSACGCAVHTTLPAGVAYTSLDLNVKFLGAMRTTTGLVTCTGTVKHRGRTTALAEAALVDSSGRLLATAQSSCLLLTP
jgi:uncharacterized protein (TIGR00369 family)